MDIIHADSNDDLIRCIHLNIPAVLHLNIDIVQIPEFLLRIDKIATLCESINVIDTNCVTIYGNSKTIKTTWDQFFIDVKINSGLYIKDFHYQMHSYFQDVALDLPLYIQDDWLNWYWKRYHKHSSDYHFLYVGGSTTHTAIHHDVCCSYSWSINLQGRKKWTIWHPSNDLNYSKEASSNNSKIIVFEQGLNELIFIPSGWSHKVENISNGEEIISINCNWFNAFNIMEIFLFLLRELNAIRKEIWHLRKDKSEHVLNKNQSRFYSNQIIGMDDVEWIQHCELLLNTNCSMNIKSFLEILSCRIMMLYSFHSTDMIILKPDWIKVFCNNFDMSMINTHDKEILKMYRETYLLVELLNSSINFMSFHIDNNNSTDDIEFIQIPKISMRDRYLELDNIVFWDFICIELSIILQYFLRNDILLLHTSRTFELTETILSDYLNDMQSTCIQLIMDSKNANIMDIIV